MNDGAVLVYREHRPGVVGPKAVLPDDAVRFTGGEDGLQAVVFTVARFEQGTVQVPTVQRVAYCNLHDVLSVPPVGEVLNAGG